MTLYSLASSWSSLGELRAQRHSRQSGLTVEVARREEGRVDEVCWPVTEREERPSEEGELKRDA